MADRQPPKRTNTNHERHGSKAQRLQAHAIQAHAITQIIAESLKYFKATVI